MMVGTLIFSLLGVAPIVVHADGLWLNTTVSYPAPPIRMLWCHYDVVQIQNFPHQVLGIAAMTAVGINVRVK